MTSKRAKSCALVLVLSAGSMTQAGGAAASPSGPNLPGSTPGAGLRRGVDPADPVAVSGARRGRAQGAPASLRSQTLFSPEEALSDSGLLVYDRTAPGTFALTGVVADARGRPVHHASVTLAPTASSPVSLETTSDSDGAFAFVDVSVDGAAERFDLSVHAPGFGSYRISRDLFTTDETYQISVELGPRPVRHDASALPADRSTLATVSGRGGYGSTSRVPGGVRVRLYKHVDGCAAGRYRRSRNFPWRFYVLHVATAEINGLWGKRAFKANAAAIQNYAWAHRIAGSPLNNTTQYQCFMPWRKIPSRWGRWVRDVLDERITHHGIQVTQYRAGSYRCREKSYKRNGNIMSQNGSRARARRNSRRCGRHEPWRRLAGYYYSGAIRKSLSPKIPRHSYSRRANGVHFRFRAPGAWRYIVQRRRRACHRPACWKTVWNEGWSWGRRAIRKSMTYRTGKCLKYRVKSRSPAGPSKFVTFNRGRSICPT